MVPQLKVLIIWMQVKYIIEYGKPFPININRIAVRFQSAIRKLNYPLCTINWLARTCHNCWSYRSSI